MITITSNESSEAELNAALVDLGAEVIVNGVPVEAAAPAVEKPSEPGKLGDKPAEAPGETTAPDTDKGKKTQEVPKGESEEDKEKAKGGWQRKIEKLTARADRLVEQLEERTGNESRLRQQLEEAKRELEAAKGTASPPVDKKEEEGPVRPKRPKAPELAAFEYDAEKFGAAQKKYDIEMDAFDDAMDVYLRTMSDKTATDRVAEERQRQVEERQEAQRVAEYNQSVDRLKETSKAWPDYEDVFGRMQVRVAELGKEDDEKVLPIDESQVVLLYMRDDSEDYAGLLRHFFLDYLDNDGADGERIVALSPRRQVAELVKIEQRLAQERAKGAPKTEAPKAAAPKVEPPAPPKQQRKTPDEPLDTVGGHGVTQTGGTLDEQYRAAAERGDNKEVARLNRLIDERRAKAQVR